MPDRGARRDRAAGHALVERPVRGVDYPGTYQEFRAWFPDDLACRSYLERVRWPDGFVCPECGCGGGWRHGRFKIDEKSWVVLAEPVIVGVSVRR